MLPLVPRPFAGEACSSWLERLGARSDLTTTQLLSSFGCSGVSAHDLDWERDRRTVSVLAGVIGFPAARITRLRCGPPASRLWERAERAWCRICLREGLMRDGEAWTQRCWRMGWAAVCRRHGRLLEAVCPRCRRTDLGCLFVPRAGRLRAICRQRDEAVNLWGEGVRAELPWGLRLDAVERTHLVALERDWARGMRGYRPLRRWRGVSAVRSLAAVVEDLVLLVLITTRTWIQPAPPLRWMVARSNWLDNFVYTPAMLPVRMAAGTLLLAARLLADPLHGAEPPVLWSPSGHAAKREALNAASFMAWLEPGQRSWGGSLTAAPPGPYQN